MAFVQQPPELGNQYTAARRFAAHGVSVLAEMDAADSRRLASENG